jgi:hypothetical protein
MSWSVWRKKCKGGEGWAARRIFEAAREKGNSGEDGNFFYWGILVVILWDYVGLYAAMG